MSHMITEKINKIITTLELELMPEEGCYLKNIYLSNHNHNAEQNIASHIYGLYAPEIESQSYFHKLSCDELWHFYSGDPLNLYLIYPDGELKTVTLSSDIVKNESPTFLVPAGVWQAGKTSKGGDYSLFGCTVIPSFTQSCFYIESKENLMKEFPKHKEIIEEFGYSD